MDNEFLTDGIKLAQRAVTFDQQNNYQIAIYFYRESIALLERYQESQQNVNVKKVESIQSKISEYQNRINTLEKVILAKENEEKVEENHQKSNEADHEYVRVNFMFNEALSEDEKGNENEAIELYTQAVELCIKLKSKVEAENQRSSEDKSKFITKIRQLAGQALSRAEILKTKLKMETCSTSSRSTSPVPVKIQAGLTTSTSSSVPSSGYTDEEKMVLLTTSKINGIEYVPFLNVDLKEKFAYLLPYSDPDGLLKLSPKQKSRFKKWTRPQDIWGSNPKIIREGGLPDCLSIKQTIVSDCSFVASLAIVAFYEKRFRTRLVTGIIYPQDKNGEPVYNPCGKYMVKLHLNGVWRKVTIDDQLPMGDQGLLCSYSKNRNGELWVSLLEKAYMKVMGGYNFPGSNSNIDLHSLIGWIPERQSINSPEFDREVIFKKLLDRLPKGDVLITLATGEISDADADRAGLVSTHAYAVLDIKDVNGIRLFQLKNPWSHLRWRGNYSELDIRHWTPEMKLLLNYNPENASVIDDGVFWIDYDSVLKFFDVIYMNWNVGLFKYFFCTHRTWSSCQGPVKDLYTIGENPQYRLEANCGLNKSAAIWVLLTRHITDIEDFKENKEYITVLVYDHKNGQKVFYPYDPPPLIDGVRINSPHYLCKISLNESKIFTLAVSQYEKMNTIHYSLRVYGTCPFRLTEIKDRYTCKKRVTGEWKTGTAGGCANNTDTYHFNPSFDVHMASSTGAKFQIEMRGPRGYHVGFDLLGTINNEAAGSSSSSSVSANDLQNQYYQQQQKFKVSSGPYRPGYVVIEADIPQGVGTHLKLIPSTFQPGKLGPFIIDIKCTCNFSIKNSV